MSRAQTIIHPNSIPLLTSLLAITIGWLIVAQPVTIPLALIGITVIGFCLIITPLSAIVFMLVLAPLRNLIVTEAPGLLPLDIGLLTIALTVAILAIHRISHGQRLFHFRGSPVYIPVGIFTFVVSLTLFTALSPGAWLSEWLKWIVILLLITLSLEIGHWKALVFSLTLAGLGHALIGLYTFLGGSGALHLLINDRFFRAFGTFGQPNPFGGFMGLLAPLALGATFGAIMQAYTYWRSDKRITLNQLVLIAFYATSTALIALGVIISWSRGAWLAFGISIVVVVLAIPRKAWQSLVLLIIVTLLGSGVWASGFLPDSIEERISSATEEIFAFNDVRAVDVTPANYAVVERLAHWQAALNMATANPWLGVGMGNYEIAYDDYRLLGWTEPLGHAHNYYLNVLAEAGIIGTVAYITLWIGIFALTWRTRHHPDSFARFVCIGLLGTWTYLSVHSLTDQLYVNNMFLHIGVMLGIVAVLYNQTWHPLRATASHITK